MAGFFGFLTVVVLVIVVLSHKVTRRSVDVAVAVLDSTLNVVQNNTPHIEDAIDKAMVAVVIQSDTAMKDMLEERFQKGNVDDNFTEAVDLHQKIRAGLELMRK